MAINLKYKTVTKLVWGGLGVAIFLGIIWGIVTKNDIGLWYDVNITLGILLFVGIWFLLVLVFKVQRHLKIRVMEENDLNEKGEDEEKQPSNQNKTTTSIAPTDKTDHATEAITHITGSEHGEENQPYKSFIPNKAQKEKFESYRDDHDIVANSQAMLDVFKKIEQYKDEITVLITGESGVGKELVAKAIHEQSNRKNKKFKVYNCAGMPDTLLQSELFGSKKGAYNDAVDRKGYFKSCDGGTIVLDEIGEISSIAQSSLLRVLENKEIQALGSDDITKVDVRVITSTNCDLVKEVENKKFRSDLLYRLDQASIHVPSLRERPTDIPLLAKHFFNVAVSQKVNKEVYKSKPLFQLLKVNDFEPLVNMEWPGNVRGLKNAVTAFVHRNFDYLHDIKSWMVEQLIKDDGITAQDLLATPTVKEHPELEEKHWDAVNAYVKYHFNQTQAKKKSNVGDTRVFLKYVHTVLLAAGDEVGFEADEVAKWLVSKLADSSVDMEKLAVEIKSRYDKIIEDYPNFHAMDKKPWEPWAHELAKKLSDK